MQFWPTYREEKKRTQPPPKENLLENFSGLKEKLSRPVVDTKNLLKKKPGKPYPPPKSFLCGPHSFLQRKVLHWSRAVYAFFFPVLTITHKMIPELIPEHFRFGKSSSEITEHNSQTYFGKVDPRIK